MLCILKFELRHSVPGTADAWLLNIQSFLITWQRLDVWLVTFDVCRSPIARRLVYVIQNSNKTIILLKMTEIGLLNTEILWTVLTISNLGVCIVIIYDYIILNQFSHTYRLHIFSGVHPLSHGDVTRITLK